VSSRWGVAVETVPKRISDAPAPAGCDAVTLPTSASGGVDVGGVEPLERRTSPSTHHFLAERRRDLRGFHTP